MRARLLQVPVLDAHSQMAMDEALLDAAEPGTLQLRLYRWKGRPPYGVTFGYSQPFAEAAEAVRRRGYPVETPIVRRCTGGGIVYHDGDITFSFVFPWAHLTAPRVVYRDIHHGVHLGLKAFRIPSRLWTAGLSRSPQSLGRAGRKPSTHVSREPGRAGRSPEGASERLAVAVKPLPQCFTAPEPEDLVHDDGTKFLGGALRRRRGKGLYQGSMRIEGLPASPERLRSALIEGFSLKWSVLFEPFEPRAEVAAAAEQLRRRRYTVDEWNKRR